MEYFNYLYSCLIQFSSVPQSCPTLCDPMDYSLPDSPIHGIFQARILEWVAISSSRRSSRPRNQICVSYVSCIDRQVLYRQRHLGSPKVYFIVNLIGLKLVQVRCTILDVWGWCTRMTQRDDMGREEGSGWGTHVYLWRIHFDIWQNQYNIVKLKNKIK